MAATGYIRHDHGFINNNNDMTSLVDEFGRMIINNNTSTSDINDSFDFVIPSGPSFRALCIFFEATCSSGHFIVMSEGLIFTQYRKIRTNNQQHSEEEDIILNRAEIFSSDLPIFKLNSKSGTYAFHISPSIFKTRLGKLPQKAEIRLKKQPGTRNIEIHILNHTAGAVLYSPLEQEYYDYDIEENISNPNVEPLCVVRALDFSNSIAHMISNKIHYIIAIPQIMKKKLSCAGYDTIGDYVGTWPIWGKASSMKIQRATIQLNITDQKEFKIELNLLRTLALLSQLNKKSCLRFYAFYCKDGDFNLLKIVSHIGSYGYLSTYIRSIE